MSAPEARPPYRMPRKFAAAVQVDRRLAELDRASGTWIQDRLVRMILERDRREAAPRDLLEVRRLAAQAVHGMPT